MPNWFAPPVKNLIAPDHPPRFTESPPAYRSRKTLGELKERVMPQLCCVELKSREYPFDLGVIPDGIAWILPTTDKFVTGLPVPIPTLPLESIRNRSTPFVEAVTMFAPVAERANVPAFVTTGVVKDVEAVNVVVDKGTESVKAVVLRSAR